MIAHLYLINNSFLWNNSDKLADFQLKMANFQKMMERINMYPEENLLYVIFDSFISTTILENLTISDIITDYDKAIETIGKEAYVILMSIIKRYIATNASDEDIKEYLTLEDADNCHGVIVFSRIKGINNHVQVLSSEQGWFDFRRHHLGKYPHNPEYFLIESTKYFPNLSIHPDNAGSMRDVIKTHPIQIIQYLSSLNDHFRKEFDNSKKDLKEFLPLFALKHELDGASLDGNKDKKFYFIFSENGRIIQAYCEAHLKMFHDDHGNANQHCRIYFKKPIMGEPYIYVGYIGEHL